MALSNISISSDTFFTHVVRTNQIIYRLSEVEGNVSNSMNAALAAIPSAFAAANASFLTSNLAFTTSNNSLVSVGNAYNAANVATIAVESAFSNSNTAFNKANSANIVASAAFAVANTASATAVAAFSTANTANSISAAAFAVANTATSAAAAAFGQANTATTSANAASAAASAAFTKANNVVAGTVSFTPSGTVSSSNVQAAIAELDAEKVTTNNPILYGRLRGGFGSPSTSGVADWNDSSNTQPGFGPTLLRGSDANGPGGDSYFHVLNLEYGDPAYGGSGQITQLAISYATPANEMWIRGRYAGTWSSWIRFWTSNTFDPATKFNTTGGTLTGPLTAPTCIINGAPGTLREIQFRSSSSVRWNFHTDTAAESGAANGSNLVLARYDNTGAWLGNPMYFTRHDGQGYFERVPYAAGGYLVKTVNGVNADSTGAVSITSGVQDVRLGAIANYGQVGVLLTDVSSGHVMTRAPAVDPNGYVEVVGRQRPIQKQIGGTWTTVSQT